MGKEINIWLITILVWLSSSELWKVVRGWEFKKKKKQQERWKQRKQGYTVIYFVKSRLPHNTKGEGGAEKFAERTAWGKRRSKGKEKGEWTKSALKNESKLDVVKSDVPWTTQTLKKQTNKKKINFFLKDRKKLQEMERKMKGQKSREDSKYTERTQRNGWQEVLQCRK